MALVAAGTGVTFDPTRPLLDPASSRSLTAT
jgi:hypothetical protein